MLTREHRLTSGQQFTRTVRTGHRAGTRTLVLHLAVRAAETAETGPHIGFVVSKAVGSAVTRNLVKRRLRHHARERVSSLPGSVALVVRALPPAATASYVALADDFDRALCRVLDRSGVR